MRKLSYGKKTLIMGVLNVTPDSFSDGGLYFDPQKAIERAQQMMLEGASIIDVGGESARPGSDPVSLEEEIKRVLPVIRRIREKLGSACLISVDTYKGEIAEVALAQGADIVNSLGGFTFDRNLAKVVFEHGCPIIIYHIKGKPKDMQKNTIYTDVVDEIKKFFKKQIELGMKNGIKREQFMIDPGIGFGKNVEQNLEIIKRLYEFKSLNLPIVIGVSRKSHLGMILQEELKLSSSPSPTERLEASLAETAIAVINGANIVRTHDVAATRKFLSVLDRLKN